MSSYSPPGTLLLLLWIRKKTRKILIIHKYMALCITYHFSVLQYWGYKEKMWEAEEWSKMHRQFKQTSSRGQAETNSLGDDNRQTILHSKTQERKSGHVAIWSPNYLVNWICYPFYMLHPVVPSPPRGRTTLMVMAALRLWIKLNQRRAEVISLHPKGNCKVKQREPKGKEFSPLSQSSAGSK